MTTESVSKVVTKKKMKFANLFALFLKMEQKNEIFLLEYLQMWENFCNFVRILMRCHQHAVILMCQTGITNTRKETKHI